MHRASRLLPKLVLSVAVLCVVAAPARAATRIYASPSGAGLHTGTSPANAYDLGEANGAVTAGTIVVMAAGTYSADGIDPNANGSGPDSSDSIVYFGAPCGNPTLTGSGSWADCDSADGSVIVSDASTINRRYIMARGIRFTGGIDFGWESTTNRAYYDSLTFCTIVGKIVGEQAEGLTIYRNRQRATWADNDTIGGSNWLLEFNALSNPRGKDITVRRNRIAINRLGSYSTEGSSDCTGSLKWCEDRAFIFRSIQGQVTVDSNRVTGSFFQHRPGYTPHESMVWYYYNIENLDSKDNNTRMTCVNKARILNSASEYFWPVMWIRDSCGIVTNSRWPYTPGLSGLRFKRDSVFACVNNDTTSGTIYFAAGNGRLGNIVVDSCFYMINGISEVETDRGALTMNDNQVSGITFTRNVIRNEIGAGFSLISPAVSGFRFENNTVWGKPAFRSEATFNVHFINPEQSTIRYNIFYSPSSSVSTGVGKWLRMDRWYLNYTVNEGAGSPVIAYRLPIIDHNLYYSGSNAVHAATWGPSGGGANQNSCIGTTDCTLGCTGENGCWYSATTRQFDLGSLHAYPEFFTTASSPDSGWGGDIKFQSPASALGWGAKPGYAGVPLKSRLVFETEAPARIQRPAQISAISDSVCSNSSMTVTWTHPGQDSFNVSLSDTNNYLILVSPIDPRSNGFLGASDALGNSVDPEWPYSDLDFINNRDSTVVQATWYRANLDQLTITGPATKARAKLTHYWPLGTGTQNPTNVQNNTTYYVLVMCRNDAGIWGTTSAYRCLTTGASAPCNSGNCVD